MSIIAVKIKIMPKSVKTNLKLIQKKVKEILEKNQVKNPQFETQPIAFGLKAIIILFGWPENKELDSLEAELQKIRNVSSIEVIDIRRAIG